MRCVACLLTGVVLMRADPQAAAQSAAMRHQDLAVDLVTLKDGQRLRGAVIEQRRDGALVVAVQRTWLKESAPEMFQRQQQEEITRRQTAYEQQLRRIADWIVEPPEDEALLRFLRQEAERLKAAVEAGKTAKAPDTQFVLLSLARSRVRRVYVQPPPRRQVALVAWREELADVEERSAAELAKELQQKDPMLLKQPVLLLDRLAWQGDDQRQWAARRALLEWTYRQPLEFQGTPEVLARTDADAPGPNLARLVSDMFVAELNRELGGDLGLLPPAEKGNASPVGEAAKTAAAENSRGMRVTQVSHDLEKERVMVVSQFYALMPNGRWQPIWTSRTTVEAAAQKPELVALIKQDPQVQQARTLLEGLGGKAATEQFERAVRFGAATYQAKDRMDNEFFDVRRLYTERLDGPPLFWPASQE